MHKEEVHMLLVMQKAFSCGNEHIDTQKNNFQRVPVNFILIKGKIAC